MKKNGAAPALKSTIHLSSEQRAEIARLTIVIPTALDQNLEICRLKFGISKNDVIKKALSEFVRANDMEPDKTPRSFTVSYK